MFYTIVIEFIHFSAYLALFIALSTRFQVADKKLKICLIFWLVLIAIYQLTNYKITQLSVTSTTVHIIAYAFMAPVLLIFNTLLHSYPLTRKRLTIYLLPVILIILTSLWLVTLPFSQYQQYVYYLLLAERIIFLMYCLLIHYHNYFLFKNFYQLSVPLKIWLLIMIVGTLVILLSTISIINQAQTSYIYSNLLIGLLITGFSVLRIIYSNLFITISSICSREKTNIRKISPPLPEHLQQQISTLLNDLSVWTNPQFSLEKMARDKDIPAYKINQYVKKTYNTSFKQHLINLRLNHATRLLQTTTDKLEIIALKSGFSSYSSFNQLFKRIHQLTPKQYRDRYQG